MWMNQQLQTFLPPQREILLAQKSGSLEVANFPNFYVKKFDND